jgi:hypothetical protein
MIRLKLSALEQHSAPVRPTPNNVHRDVLNWTPLTSSIVDKTLSASLCSINSIDDLFNKPVISSKIIKRDFVWLNKAALSSLAIQQSNRYVG